MILGLYNRILSYRILMNGGDLLAKGRRVLTGG